MPDTSSTRPATPDAEATSLEGPPCCSWAGEDFHDELLAIEHRGVGAALELLLSLTTDGQLPGSDIVTFVGTHNWLDPAAMFAGATMAGELSEAWLAQRPPRLLAAS